ncbi:MAG: ABC transporter permease [Candidatus Schekmanbacteria bacterium]|nr:MAG: ABC transporter permease [Candidatus Schekmanbacteria bacterium]
MFKKLINLFVYRELLYNLAMKDIKGRYKQTIIGAGWAIFQPFVMMIVFTIVFSIFAKIPSKKIPYPLFAFCGLSVWAFFSSSITKAVSSIIQNVNLVTKIYFPREILPFSSISAAFLDFIIAMFLCFLMTLFYGITLSPYIFLFPIILIIQLLLISGLSLFFSALNVFKRDINYLIPIFLQIWMFLSPVVYPVAIVPSQYKHLYMLNPAAGIIEGYRSCLLYGSMPSLKPLIWAGILSLFIFLLSYFFFKKVEMKFADII